MSWWTQSLGILQKSLLIKYMLMIFKLGPFHLWIRINSSPGTLSSLRGWRLRNQELTSKCDHYFSIPFYFKWIHFHFNCNEHVISISGYHLIRNSSSDIINKLAEIFIIFTFPYGLTHCSTDFCSLTLSLWVHIFLCHLLLSADERGVLVSVSISVIKHHDQK